MIYIVAALHCEAKPVAGYYGLIKDSSLSRFEIYKNSDISLIISGTGMLKSAVASAYLFSSSPYKSDDIAVNFGICGSLNPDCAPGRSFLVNKVMTRTLSKTYYPDMLLMHGLPEASLETFPFPVVRSSAAGCLSDLVDMEAAGFMEAATAFFPPHRIYCLKVVSDRLEGTRLAASWVSELIKQNLPALDEIIKNAVNAAYAHNTVFSAEEADLLDEICNNLKLTATMKHQLKSFALQYKIRYRKDLKFLRDFLSVKSTIKGERKKYFEAIRNLLTS